MTDQLTHEGVLILDFGSQFTQLIARRIRELEVYSEIKPCTIKPNAFDLKNVKAVILSGGPASVTDSDAPYFDPGWFELGLPVLGLCYGQQLVAHHFGGRLASGAKREYGRAQVKITDPSSIFSGFNAGEEIQVWMSHGDHVAEIPSGFKSLAISSGSPFAAMENAQRRIYTTQFHPEVAHTLRGKEILGNFIFKIVGLKKNWSAHGFIESTIEQLRGSLTQDSQVLCALSGGVDSTVAATLVHRAIGSRLHCIFVDNGLLRKDEAAKVMKFLGEAGLGLNIKLINAREEFLSELRDVIDPEQKRKIIGRVFIEVFDREAHKISNVTHLVQGTLYPDVIESLSTKGPSATIKSHHNVGGLPEKMKLKLIEPLRELFKDEVRRIGAELGIPSDVLKRHPFPGPGLAVRVLGSLDEERLGVLRDADQIFQEEVLAAGVYDKLWQSFAVLLPVRSVGVMGDGRTYEQTIALRAVESDDGMTADWAYLPRTLLERVSSRVINEVKGVNRVVLDISTKPPATIEWE